jgi:ribosomal 50S subunit-recycling heat shock protein
LHKPSPGLYASSMRLDKYLKLSRLIKRRSVANSVATAGHIWVNGKLAKPAHTLHVGDELLINLGEHRQLRVRVLIIPITKSVPPDLAASLYDMLEDDPDDSPVTTRKTL